MTVNPDLVALRRLLPNEGAFMYCPEGPMPHVPLGGPYPFPIAVLEACDYDRARAARLWRDLRAGRPWWMPFWLFFRRYCHWPTITQIIDRAIAAPA